MRHNSTEQKGGQVHIQQYRFPSVKAVTLNHIYCEFNQLADCLSKKALSLALGSGNYSEFIEGHSTSHDCFVLFWAKCWSMYSFYLLHPILICYGVSSFRLLFCSHLFTVDMVWVAAYTDGMLYCWRHTCPPCRLAGMWLLHDVTDMFLYDPPSWL